MQYYTWVGMDNNAAARTLAATGNNLCQLRADGFIYRWVGSATLQKWDRIDDTPSTVAVVTDGDMVYKLHSDGYIFWYDPYDVPNWSELGNDSSTTAIAATEGSLLRLMKDGSIDLFDGTPDNWTRLDNNPATIALVCSGYHIYQLHNTGAIYEYNGTPLTGWLTLDTNPSTVAIAADGDDLYQLHNDGSVWLFDRDALNWTMIGDPNGFATFAIVAGNGTVLQLQNDVDNHLFMYTGEPRTGWLPIFSSSEPFRAVAVGVPQQTPPSDDGEETPTGIYTINGSGLVTQYFGIHDD
jgi:hypothetical protein